MKEYSIFKTIKFIKLFEKLDETIRKEFEKQIQRLKINPYIGKALYGTWFRELKVKKYRLYFLVYEDRVKILLISISNKKEQQKEIEFIK